jgi:hypothetical protein
MHVAPGEVATVHTRGRPIQKCGTSGLRESPGNLESGPDEVQSDARDETR